jgi:adenine deaminase
VTDLSRAQRLDLVAVAQGAQPADLVIENARVVDVHTLTVFRASVAIKHGFIACVGETGAALETVDANGAFLAPGLVDGHIHVESSLLTPRRFAQITVPRGTVGVVAEPHEIVNVCGASGLEWMLRDARRTPLRVWGSVPSCVPASQFEVGGARLGATEIARLLEHPQALGLAEMMNYPGVLGGDAEVWAILEAALTSGKRLDGHAPGVHGRAFQAYVAAGLESDHEMTTEAEAFERLRAGAWIMVRDGSAARDLAKIAPLLKRLEPARAMFVTDDADAAELVERGHLDRLLRLAVQCGIRPAYAIRALSLAPADYWGLKARGAVAPGNVADLVLFEDLEAFGVRWTMVGGRIVAQDGRILEEVLDGALEEPAQPDAEPVIGLHSVHLPKTWGARDLEVKHPGRRPVIGIVPGQIRTVALEKQRLLIADPSRDLVKIAVVERHRGTGRTGVGFVHGTGLKRGAFAQTVAHDHHNVIAIGVDDADMALAVQVLAHIGGGAVCVLDGEVKAALELPVAGLMSDAPAAEVVAAQRALEAAAHAQGCTLAHPVVTLSFLALTVIPSLKITDQGLFDVDAWQLLEAKTTNPSDPNAQPSGDHVGIDNAASGKAELDPLKSSLSDTLKAAASEVRPSKRLLN